MKESQPRTVLITGGSRGIGRAAVIQFAEAGWQVAFNYRQHRKDAEILTDALTAEGYTVLPVCCDITDREQVTTFVRVAEETFGTIDVLVNNAGVGQQKLFTDLTEQDWDTIFNVNVKGVFHTSQAVLPGMIRQKKGCIINVASMWGETGASCEAHYSAAKAAVIGLTRALAKEVGLSGIRVNCVSPGVINTDMNALLDRTALDSLAEETPLARIGTPEEVANVIAFLASKEAEFITGQVIGVNGGYYI